MTLEEFYKATEGMPKDTQIKAVMRLSENRSFITPNLKVEISGGMIKITNDPC